MRCAKAAASCLVALLVAAMPVRISLSGPGLLHFQNAEAKNGNNGNGNNGNGGSGNGNGNAGSKGSSSNSGGSKNDNKSGGRAGTQTEGQSTGKQANSVVAKVVTEDSVQINYRNGIREQVIKDRFIMTDAKGRTIINRPATGVDRLRLWLKQAGQ